MNERRLMWGTAIAGLLAALVLTGVALVRGDLNQDEGWYLYGARLVAEGKRPYLDFASTQGPVMSYTYALAEPLVRRWGLMGGRLFTAGLAVLVWACAAWLAWRLAPGGPAGRPLRARAAVLALLLVGVNVFQCYYGTIVKTYSLAALWLLLGFLALTRATGRGAAGWAGVAGLAMMAAAGTRISAVLAPAAVGLLLLLGRPRHWPCTVGFVIGCAAGGALIFLPFLLAAPEATWFGLVSYHAGRDPGGALAGLAYKAGFVSRVSLAYAAAVGLALVLLVHRLVGQDRPPATPASPWSPAVGWSILAVSLVHALAPFPYDDYQALIYPLAAVALAVALVRRVPAAWPVPAVGVLCAMLALASPLVQGWFVGPRDRIWWPLKTQSPLAVLQETAARLRAQPDYEAGALLLTQDPYLAVEAGLRLPVGLELGQFCYFPDWDTARARRCRVLNRELFEALLDEAPAPLAAFSGYGFAIRSPDVLPVSAAEQEAWRVRLERRYESWAEVTPFGQADTTLRLYRRRPDS